MRIVMSLLLIGVATLFASCAKQETPGLSEVSLNSDICQQEAVVAPWSKGSMLEGIVEGQMTPYDTLRLSCVLEYTLSNQRAYWHNPTDETEYEVFSKEKFAINGSSYEVCRIIKITSIKNSITVAGTACRNREGIWEIQAPL